ncbi:hypothetical protein [uncultured virus]|jgi:hypothetical protein|uniref:Uncharacterized protein n=1 Tax=uncultured virus TaxID=340016 RepID=A0A218MMG4_9VIRU|nr:hypothetical protein [uncultured virus]
MGTTTFQGPVVSKKGFFSTGPGNVVDADSSISLTVADHAGRIVHNDAAGAVTYTLPATNANSDSAVAGPGADFNNLSNVGATIEIFSSITKTGDMVIQVANATDVMVGSAVFIDDSSDNVVGFETASTSDTITLNGSTKGGVTFSKIVCTVLASGKWKVDVLSGCTGTPATPFSAAVS